MNQHVKNARKTAEMFLARVGLRYEYFRLLHDGQNITFKIFTQSKTYTLRVSYAAQNENTVRNEIAWMNAILEDTNLIIPKPILFTKIRQRDCVLFEWLKGTRRSKSLNGTMLRAVGKTASILHEHGKHWRAPSGWMRPMLDNVYLNSPSPVGNLPESYRSVFLECEDRLKKVLKRLVEEDAHVIHADFHQGNFLFRPNNEVCVLDFDNSAIGNPAQDLAISLYYLKNHKKMADLFEGFIDGYSQHRRWPLNDGLISALFAWRAMSLCARVYVHPSDKLRKLIPHLLPKWNATIIKYMNSTI